MSEFIVLALVEMEDGTAVCVTAPTGQVDPGNVVYFDGGKHGVVQHSEWIDKNSGLYTIIDSMIPIYPVESVWFFAQTWPVTPEKGE